MTPEVPGGRFEPVLRLRIGLTPLAYLSHLGISSFRNLAELNLDLPPGVVVFFGANAQGKTALLEAVYILAIARSFRAENEREVVNFQAAAEEGMALVNGVIESGGEQLRVYVGYQSVTNPAAQDTGGGRAYSVRKQIRVSRVRRTAAELVGLVNAVLFSVEDIELVHGPPSGRRRFLDILLSQAEPIYVKTLQRYQKVVQQRNQLLRLLRDGRAQADELAFWDAQLVTEGAWITWRRKEALADLAPICVQQHRDLGGQEGDLSVTYRPSVPFESTPGDTVTHIEARFREALAAAQGRERATAATAVGPHRDDFDMLIEQVDMGIYASRGQARTLALTLKLSEAAYLTAVRSDGPIVLLDDVLSEMDASRRDKVLGKANQYQQALITTTDVGLVRDYFGSGATYFQVEAGVVSPVAGSPPV